MSAPRPWLRAGGAPDAPALVIEGRVLGRAELAARANALAAWLARAGVREGEIVGALLPNGLRFAALLHALDRVGAILLPLNARLAPRELAFQLRDAGAHLVLHDGGPLASRAEAAARRASAAARPGGAGSRSQAEPSEVRQAGRVAALRLPESPTSPKSIPEARRSLDAPLAVLYTSGTTGRPKGTLLSHRNFRASAEASARHLGLGRDDRWLACLPPFHVGGLNILLRGALHGIPVVVHDRFDPEVVSRSLDADGITHTSLVPAMLARLLDARGERPAPPGLRCVLLGGGPAPAALLERASKLGFPLAPTYGLTEATSQVATLRPGSDADPARAGLEPLPGTELRIRAQGGRAAAAGEPGEILVRGPTVMRGYLNRPAETRRALRGGWLHTGDVGHLDAGGRLFVLDRRRDLIISGGENIYPAEVEAVLLEHPDVREAAVAGVPDPAFGRRPVAWLVLRPARAPAPRDLARFCRARLAAYKVPVRFHSVEALPRNAAGKLLRRRLQEDAGQLTGGEHEPARRSQNAARS